MDLGPHQDHRDLENLASKQVVLTMGLILLVMANRDFMELVQDWKC